MGPPGEEPKTVGPRRTAESARVNRDALRFPDTGCGFGYGSLPPCRTAAIRAVESGVLPQIAALVAHDVTVQMARVDRGDYDDELALVVEIAAQAA